MTIRPDNDVCNGVGQEDDAMDGGGDDDDRSGKSLEEPLGGEDESVSSREDGWEPSDAEARLEEERKAGAFFEGFRGTLRHSEGHF